AGLLCCSAYGGVTGLLDAASSTAAATTSALRNDLHGDVDREGRRGARKLDALFLENSQQLGLRAGTWIVRCQHVRRRAFGLRLEDRPPAFLIAVVEDELAVVGDVVERNEQSGLFVIVIVAERPHHPRERRVLLEPAPLRVVRPEDALLRVGTAAVAECLVETADAVV